jgi:hypothetical protein
MIPLPQWKKKKKVRRGREDAINEDEGDGDMVVGKRR